MTNNIVVLGFENQYGAEAMLENVHRWQEEGLLAVEDAVVAFAGPDGRVEIEQTHRSEAGKFGLRGGGVGLLAGALLGGPVLGLVAGATYGTIKGKKRDKELSLDKDFVEAASEWVHAERSALFLLVKQADPAQAEASLAQLRAQLAPHTAAVLTTTLPPEREALLRQMLAEEEYGAP